MNAHLPEQRWRAAGGPALLWRRWDQEFVVFDARSGDIHLLDPVAAEALRCLEGASATVDELGRKLGASLGLEGEREVSTYVAKLVGELDELGLIEPAAVDRQRPLPG